MDIDGVAHRTIWRDDEGRVRAIDQRSLPFSFEIVEIGDHTAMATAIADMTVRGAGLIGAAAGYGMYLAARAAASADPTARASHLAAAADALTRARPTAVNLSWAVSRMLDRIDVDAPDMARTAGIEADAIADEDVAACRSIGAHGLPILRDLHHRTGRAVNVLTHCNAGWLAFVDHGTATAPIYAAHDAGIPVHVWVDETRPRNQGARLTAWELGRHGVDHTVIVDNAGGHLMQRGLVDAVIVGSDRTTSSGDVANKIGTYLKALAAVDNDVPFYVALPSSTVDWSTVDGATIPIEERDPDEVTCISGPAASRSPTGACDGTETRVRLTPEGTAALNHGFDVTPARLVTGGLITERGICAADEDGIGTLFPRGG